MCERREEKRGVVNDKRNGEETEERGTDRQTDRQRQKERERWRERQREIRTEREIHGQHDSGRKAQHTHFHTTAPNKKQRHAADVSKETRS